MQGTTHLNLNSGFFYIQANERTISLMERIAARLAKEKAWDQVRLRAQSLPISVPFRQFFNCVESPLLDFGSL